MREDYRDSLTMCAVKAKRWISGSYWKFSKKYIFSKIVPWIIRKREREREKKLKPCWRLQNSLNFVKKKKLEDSFLLFQQSRDNKRKKIRFGSIERWGARRLVRASMPPISRNDLNTIIIRGSRDKTERIDVGKLFYRRPVAKDGSHTHTRFASERNNHPNKQRVFHICITWTTNIYAMFGKLRGIHWFFSLYVTRTAFILRFFKAFHDIYNIHTYTVFWPWI